MKEQLVNLTSKDIRSNPDFHQISPDYSVIEGIKQELGQGVFGQERAIDQLARAVTRSWAGFSDPNRPEGVFMFLGPTGVGKTETAKQLAKYLHPRDWESRFLRIDCTEFQEPHTISRLKGTEPGYIGYGDNNIIITPDFLAQSGPKVIVLDEIEKAHGNFDRFFMPIFSEGRTKVLAPAKGNKGWSSELVELNFADTYFIMTSNVGAHEIHKAKQGREIGFHHGNNPADLEQVAVAEMKRMWQTMPEFLGRIDSTIVFNDLERPQYEQIFNKFMAQINEAQTRGQNFLAATRELRDYVIDHSNTQDYGAREIMKGIKQHIVDKASEIKFSGVLQEGQFLVGDLEDNSVIFWTNTVKEAPPEPQVRAVTPFKKKDIPDTDIQSIGGKNEDDFGGEPPVPSEETGTKKEDSEPETPRGGVNFYIPLASGDFGSEIDLAITVRQKGKKDLSQIITGLPLLPAR